MNKESCLGGAMREKYWEELTVEERVEVLGKYAEYLEKEVRRLSGIAYKASSLVKEHKHLDGEVVVSARDGKGDCTESESRGRSLLNRQPK